MKRKVIIKSLNRTTTRAGLSIILLFITMLIIIFYLAQNYRSNLIEFRKKELQRQVEMSLNTIDPILEQVRSGELDRETAIDEIVLLLRRMTYTSETMKNYIFMSSYTGTMLVQPLEPWLQHTNQLHARDSYGNYYIQDLIAAAESPEGEGFVSYFYPPPGSDNPGEKLSYVRGVPEIGCYIGTGMFFNDINKLFREYLLGPMLIIVVGFTAIYLLIIMYLRPLIKCFQILLGSFHLISVDPFEDLFLPISDFPEDSDEHEILSGFEKMIENLKRSREELIQADKLASLGVLVSGVAHEINNPNQFILSNAGIFEGVWSEVVTILDDYYKQNGDFIIQGNNYSELKEMVPEYITGMQEGARRIGKIVEDLKILSRNDSSLPWSNVDINNVLRAAINLCMNMLRKATDRFALELDENIPAVYGNSQQIEQVFINLIQNAAQALTDYSQGISIKSEVTDDGEFIKILIADEGCGISKENLNKILDPFYTTKRETGGTGIGLSISSNIISEHKGKLEYFSRLDAGTTAVVLLPASGKSH